MQGLDRPKTSDMSTTSKLHKITNACQYEHLMSDPSSKQQAGPLFRWLLDLRIINNDESKKCRSNSDFHDQLAYKDKKRNTTSGDFKLGNINKVRHVLDAKTTTNSDCNFLFNLRSYINNNNKNKNNQDKDDEGKKEPERWVDCPY